MWFLVALSAAAYSAAFPPLSVAPLMWIALVPFFLAVTRVSPASAALLGAAWGALLTLGVGWCLPGMLVAYFQLPRTLAWVGFLTLALSQSAVYYATFAGWLSWLARRAGGGPLIIAAGWGACEFARARMFVGNPWALAGYSQINSVHLIQIADATGPYGLGILIAAVNATVGGLLSLPLRGRHYVLSSIGTTLGLVGTLAYGAWRLSEPIAAGPPFRVAAIQGAVQREVVWRPEYRRIGLGRYLDLTEQAFAARPDIVFWPENAVGFYLQEPSPESSVVLDLTRRFDADLVLGGPSYSYGETATRYHNSVFLVRDGRIAGRYDKLHLVPVAEDGLLGKRARAHVYSPGRRLRWLRTSVAFVGTFVCFEAMYPEIVRRFALAGADVFANLSNDAWFGYAAPARHHLEMAALRAVENRRYLVRVASTGYSAVIDPRGRMVTVGRFGVPELLTTTIHASRVRTPYQRWGDATAWLAVAFAFAATCVSIVSRPRVA